MPKTHSKVKFSELQVAAANEDGQQPQMQTDVVARLRALAVKFEPVLASLSWGSCSIGMTVLNKMSVSKTRAPVAVVIVQMLATCAMATASGNLKFGAGWRLWAVSVPPLFVLMMVSSMLALKYVTVGTFVVVRNLGPVVTLIAETLLHNPENLSLDWRTLASTAAIAGVVDLRSAGRALGGWFFYAPQPGAGGAERCAAPLPRRKPGRREQTRAHVAEQRHRRTPRPVVVPVQSQRSFTC